MQRQLRKYQSDGLQKARVEISKGFKSVLIQLVTGGGKTRMVGQVVNNAINKYIPGTDQKQNIWFVVPRKELLWQSSEEFQAWDIRHGMITANSRESAAFQVHICSKDTLVKRIKNKLIKRWPSIIIIDEAHLALKQQLLIKKNAPKNTIFLGMTATPERLDGMGLNQMYESIVFGPSLQWMVEKYLKRPKIYSIPPIDGIKDLKRNKAGEVSAKELTALYMSRATEKRIYGNQIEHYRKYGVGRAFLVFCRSIIDAERIAEEFTESGFRVESIDGSMTDRQRKQKIDAVKNGRLDGLTTVDLVTYGLDVPRISCIIMLRPTDSVALFFQMIGRGLRPDNDFDDCLIFDHVGNCSEENHGHPLAPRVWNFQGIERKKRPKNAVCREESVSNCPICFRVLRDDGWCDWCEQFFDKVGMNGKRQPLKSIDGWLVPITDPTPLNMRPKDNRREYEQLINSCRENFRRDWELSGKINNDAVEKLLNAAKDLKRQPLWVYHYLNAQTIENDQNAELEDNEISVNFSLLMAIQKIQGYKNGWAWYKRKELEKRKAG